MIRNKKILTDLDHTQREYPFDRKAWGFLDFIPNLAVADSYTLCQRIERFYLAWCMGYHRIVLKEFFQVAIKTKINST